MENKRRVAVLATPLALLLLLLFLIPLSTMVIYSIRGGTFYEEARNIITLRNYQVFFSNPSFLNLFLRTVALALTVGVLAVLFAYPIAYFLAFRSGSHRATLLTLMIVPAWTSYLLRIVAIKFLLGSNGLINSLLLSAGLIEEGLPIFLYSSKAVVITLVYVWIPFASLPIFLVLDRIDRGLLEASADLGCPPWVTFLRVTLPLSIPGIIASLLYVFIPTLGDYVTPMLMGGVQSSTYFGNLIQMQFGAAMDWPMGSAFSVFLVVTILLLLVIFSRLINIQNYFKS